MLLLNDQKAYGVLSVCFSLEISQTLRDFTTAKGLWDALTEKFKSNVDMRNYRKEMLRGEFNMFNHIQGELVGTLINRFETLVTKKRSVGVVYDQSEINSKLLNSLPYTWNSSVTTHQKNNKFEHYVSN
ncbi:uncharacterized protein LOC143566147 [Bidens hawaiensis]|uniref:uncharacterized protein LOC143566147 n=1 Tax=Bidens hawaiensis TaxID=980011 RepID=UPI00404AA8A4